MFSQTLYAVEMPTYFGKTLDTQALEASFPQQGPDLIAYIQSQGVDVISVEPGQSPLVSQADRLYWQRHLLKYSALGRYNSPGSVSSLVDQPTIILYKISDKWTTLHEYMHFLFEKRRLEMQMKQESELYEAQQNARTDYLEISQMMRTLTKLDIGILSRAAKAFAEFVKYEIQLARQSVLEEVAIEQTLSYLYRRDKIPGLYTSQYRTAQDYIQRSVEKFNRQIESFDMIHEDLKKQWIGPENADLQTSSRSLQIVKAELHQALISQ